MAPKAKRKKEKTEVEVEIKTRPEWLHRLQLAAVEDWPAASLRALEVYGKARGWDQPIRRPPRAPKYHTDPRKRLEAEVKHLGQQEASAELDRSWVAAAAIGDKRRDAQKELERLSGKTETATPAELLAELIADLPGWSDDEFLAVHAAGLAKGIPGFVER